MNHDGVTNWIVLCIYPPTQDSSHTRRIEGLQFTRIPDTKNVVTIENLGGEVDPHHSSYIRSMYGICTYV